MRYYIALVHKDADSAYGISFPDLPAVFSASDNEEEIVSNAVEALRLWAEDENLPTPSTHAEILARDDVRDELKAGAFLVRIPVIEEHTRTVRANITLEAGTLAAIDAAAKKRGLTRSAFLAQAARREIQETA